MADDLDKLIEDQKAKLAQDKAELENDPPYMEMRNKESEKLSETSKMLISMAKENIPPNSQQNYYLGDYGMSLPLGEEYERKRHKLKEELQQDYRRYLSQVKLLVWLHSFTENKKPVTRLQRELHAEVQPRNTGAEPPKKDAFTSTEAYEELLYKRWLEEDRYRRLDDEVESRSRLLNRRFDEDLDVPGRRYREFARQSVIPIRKHHRLDEDHDFDRRYYRMDYDPETSEEMDPRFRSESAFDRKTPRIFYTKRLHESKLGNSSPERDIYADVWSFPLGCQDPEHLQRKKEKYRQELIEQMAEQQRNRRR
uniref:CSPP1 n=1 Tax=Falco tinnunculus TaxID=100819 RepID=A0A8C4TUH3_FALTI